MTREEIITKVQNLINQAYKYDIDSEYYEGLFDEIEKLRQPPTLAEFLGWEEGVEYDYCNARFRIKNGVLERRFTDAYNVDRYWELAEERLTDSRINELRQAKKVEKKLKAYHVKDEYSYKCLMRELKEQGYVWRHGGKPTKSGIWENAKYRDVIYCKENKTITYSNLPHYKKYAKDNYDLIEYHKEEPRYYARYKGSINLYQDYNYYNYLAWKGVCVISDKGEVFDSIIQMTKTEWNKLGINDTNADFEEVEE